MYRACLRGRFGQLGSISPKTGNFAAGFVEFCEHSNGICNHSVRVLLDGNFILTLTNLRVPVASLMKATYLGNHHIWLLDVLSQFAYRGFCVIDFEGQLFDLVVLILDGDLGPLQ